jgi:hypothetical protein
MKLAALALLLFAAPLQAVDYENGNRNREWDVAFQADPGGPAELRFDGPDVGDPNEPVVVRLMGIDLDATKTLAEIFAEIRKVRIEINAPKEATATFSSELKIDPIKGELRLDLAIVADKPGVYLLSALWVEGEAVGFTQHRLTVGQMPQPPPVVVDPVDPVDPVKPATGDRWVVVIEEARDARNGPLFVALRQKFDGDPTLSKHTYLAIDDDTTNTTLAPWIARSAGKTLPWMIVAEKGAASAKLLWEGPMPQTVDDVLKQMEATRTP